MKRTRNTKVPKKAMLIVAASEFEALFLSQVRKDCRYTNLTVARAENPRDLEDLVKQAAKLRYKGKYDKVWALFGLDDFPGLAPAAIAEAREAAAGKRVSLGWAAPSLSLWIYLHLKAPAAPVSDSKMFVSALAKALPGYEETALYLAGKGQNLHLSLFTNFSKAVSNATLYNRICEKATGVAATNIPDIYSDIHKICGIADLTHNQKMLTKRA